MKTIKRDKMGQFNKCLSCGKFVKSNHYTCNNFVCLNKAINNKNISYTTRKFLRKRKQNIKDGIYFSKMQCCKCNNKKYLTMLNSNIGICHKCLRKQNITN